MNEEEKKKASSEQEEGESAETPKSLIEKAEAAANRIEAANAKQEELVERQEAAKTREMLGGKAEAGQAQAVKIEETPHEYRVRVERELAQGKTEFGN